MQGAMTTMCNPKPQQAFFRNEATGGRKVQGYEMTRPQERWETACLLTAHTQSHRGRVQGGVPCSLWGGCLQVQEMCRELL